MKQKMYSLLIYHPIMRNKEQFGFLRQYKCVVWNKVYNIKEALNCNVIYHPCKFAYWNLLPWTGLPD